MLSVPKRDDNHRDAQQHGYNAIEQSANRARSQSNQQRKGNRQAFLQGKRGNNIGQRENGADGQINVAHRHDKHHAHRHDADIGRLPRHFQQVQRSRECGRRNRKRNAKRHEGDQNAEFL